MLSIKNRITTPSEFYQIKKFGKKISNSFFSILFIVDSNKDSKFSFTIAKKYSPKASDRNRIKRLSRALARENLTIFPKGTLAIIFPKTKILNSPYSLLIKEFNTLINEIKA